MKYSNHTSETDIQNAVLASISEVSNLKLPDPELVTFYQNANQRRLWIDLSVDETGLDYARMILQWNFDDIGLSKEERTPIYLYLFNYGGSADIAWMLTDTIALSETPVYTVNVGQCASAAALLFMCGHKRFAFPSSTVVIHEGSGEISGDAVKVMDQAKSYETMLKKMHKFILNHTSIPEKLLNKKKNNDWELDADSCLQYGVCDEIVTSIDQLIWGDEA